MKRHFRLSLLYIVLPLLAISLPLLWQVKAAADTKSVDWYFKPTKDHSQPALCPEADFLKQYRKVIALGSAEQKTLYLTFDAGFDNGYHDDILDTLKEKGVKAAFFVDGNFVKTNPDLVKRITGEGHILGNHTLKHPDMSAITDFSAYRTQVEGWENLVREAGAEPTNFFRFPSGKFSERCMEYNQTLGLTTVFWSFAYYDWDTDAQPDPAAALQKIASRMHNGAVVLLHSTSATNAEILGEYIDQMRNESYTFKPLTEFTPSHN